MASVRSVASSVFRRPSPLAVAPLLALLACAHENQLDGNDLNPDELDAMFPRLNIELDGVTVAADSPSASIDSSHTLLRYRRQLVVTANDPETSCTCSSMTNLCSKRTVSCDQRRTRGW